MNPILILIRHAHRDVSDRSLDNGLSEKGKQQAEDFAKWFVDWSRLKSLKPSQIEFKSSKKQRCQETLEPVARLLSLDVSIEPLLHEQKSEEGESTFRKRIESFFTKWKQTTTTVTVACSHGDWIPLAMETYFGISCDVRKGQWLVLEFKNGRLSMSDETLSQKAPS